MDDDIAAEMKRMGDILLGARHDAEKTLGQLFTSVFLAGAKEAKMSRYEVRKREWPDAFPPLKRPWGLYRDGVIIGMYETREKAEAAKSPEGSA